MFSGNGIEDTLASASCFGFWIWGFLKHTHPVWLYTSPQTKGRFVFPYPDPPKWCCSPIWGAMGKGRNGRQAEATLFPQLPNHSRDRPTNLTLGAETHWKLSGSILSPNIWRNQVSENRELDSSQTAEPEWAEPYWVFSLSFKMSQPQVKVKLQLLLNHVFIISEHHNFLRVVSTPSWLSKWNLSFCPGIRNPEKMSSQE